MSLSGSNTGALYPIVARDILEEALTRAGVPIPKFTPEIFYKALDIFNLMLQEMPNKGVQTWKRQQRIVPCYLNRQQMPLPAGVNTVLNINRRTLFRQIGVPFSTSGNAALAFDDNFDTKTVQLANNGELGCLFTNATQVTTIGILTGSAGLWSTFFEYTMDGINWVSLDAVTIDSQQEGEWFWFDLDGAPNAFGWRIRVIGDVPLSVVELFFGNTPQIITLGAWNLDEWSQMVLKTEGGQVLNWYQQRNLDAPVLYVWPVPNWMARYDHLVVWTHNLMEDLTDVSQTVDVPRRFNEAITATLARRLCRSIQEADMKRYGMLRGEEMEAWELAAGEDKDKTGGFNFNPGIYPYTR